MNLTVHFRDVLRKVPALVEEWDKLTARVNLLWAKEHDPLSGLHRPSYLPATFGYSFEGGGVALTAGRQAQVEIPFDATIVAARMFADQAGSAVVDLWKKSYANYRPTAADSITGSAKPTITSAVKSEDLTLSGWNTRLDEGEIVVFNIDSVSTIQLLTVQLTVVRR